MAETSSPPETAPATDNAEIARLLGEMADLLEIRGANPFRVRAYRNAVRTVESQSSPLARRVAEGEDLTSLPGIGKEMAGHIAEIVETGSLGARAELLEHIPVGLLDLIHLPNVGPKRAKKLWDELGVTSVDELETAAKSGRVASVEGFGAKSQEKILSGIREFHDHRSRFRLDEADRRVGPLLDYLRGFESLQRLEVAGSYRRRRETVGDLDLLAIAPEGAGRELIRRFVEYPQVERTLMAGDTRASVELTAGLQVDLRVVPPESYGAALVYFTGSKEHNVKLRQRAVRRGLKISEYGVFQARDGESAAEAAEDPRSGERVAGAEEADVYSAVDLPWIAPELREDRGEIEAAERGELPDLITVEDLRGDLQMHSTWSDGKASIEEMLEACAARGYEYFALTDHSKALGMANGLDAVRLREQWKEIEEVVARHPEIRLLRSLEVDILADGSLDLDDEMLERLDLVVVSVHSRFELPAAEQTERILAAVRHPAVNILAHPTGRLLGRRKPFEFDLDEVLHACREHRVAVELNAHPERLDLKDTHLMRARELEVPVVISTDAHRPDHLDLMRYGVEQARRAWLEPRHVLNTRPLSELLEALGK
jgi:DNA polymerase (family 10)